MNMENWWNDDWHGKTEINGKTFPRITLSTTIPNRLLCCWTQLSVIRSFLNMMPTAGFFEFFKLRNDCRTQIYLLNLRSARTAELKVKAFGFFCLSVNS